MRVANIITCSILAILVLGKSVAFPGQESNANDLSRAPQKVKALIQAGDLDGAEQILNGISDRTRGDVVSLRANIALRRQDFSGCLNELSLLFDPTSPEVKVRYTTGFEHERAWYYLLHLQKGMTAKAQQIRSDLLNDNFLKTDDSGFYDFTSASPVPVVAVYLHMAALDFAIGNTHRCRAYLRTARQLDPKVKIDPCLERSLNLIRSSEKAELDYDRRGGMFVMLPSYDELKKMFRGSPRALFH